jgi:hypothetical protein
MLTAFEAQGGIMPPEPSTWRFSLDDGTVLDCAVTPAENTWYAAVQSGCPQASIVLGRRLTLANLVKTYDTWGFDEVPVIPVASARPSKLSLLDDLIDTSLGQGDFRVSPLQVALAAAAYSTGGPRPSPLLAMAVNTPNNGWVILPVEPSSSTYPRNVLVNHVEKFTLPGTATWQTVGQAVTEEGIITWVIGGTVSSWQGAPLVLALVLEEDNPDLARSIASQVLAETMR